MSESQILNDVALTARIIAFKGDSELADRSILIELTDTPEASGVEIAFDVPKGAERVYLRFDLLELLKLRMQP